VLRRDGQTINQSIMQTDKISSSISRCVQLSMRVRDNNQLGPHARHQTSSWLHLWFTLNTFTLNLSDGKHQSNCNSHACYWSLRESCFVYYVMRVAKRPAGACSVRGLAVCRSVQILVSWLASSLETIRRPSVELHSTVNVVSRQFIDVRRPVVTLIDLL